MDKTTYFGRAGEFYAMSELLLRGWNVAVPVVDVGDDVFVIADNDKTTYRVQVKTAAVRMVAPYLAQFTLSRRQLAQPLNIELIYFFLVRIEDYWRCLVIPRVELDLLRVRFETRPRTGPGRRPASAQTATSDTLRLELEMDSTSASAWGGTLDTFLDQWPKELPYVADGPGTRGISI